MSIKIIPDSWKEDIEFNYNHKYNFFINPRGRVFPPLTSAGISYIKNDFPTNMRGTYRMQCGASTSLTYLYTLPQRFIIEGWFKPEFAYGVVSNQFLWNTIAQQAFVFYDSSIDALRFRTTVGGVNNYLDTTAFTTDAGLQKWVYVRCFFDNIAKLKGFYCTVNGVVYADSQNVPGAGDFTPLNTISFFPSVAAESSYWIIHELDETLATGEYKTYEADRQIIFDFNGLALGRERIRIPRINIAGDNRGVKGYSITKKIEDELSGSACANSASLTLYNTNGQFSDDQYIPFDPYNGHYNGTQKYLQNRVGIEIESSFKNIGGISNIFNGGTTPEYLQYYWGTIDGWAAITGTVVIGDKSLLITSTGPYGRCEKIAVWPALSTIRLRIRKLTTGGGNLDIYWSDGVANTLLYSSPEKTIFDWRIINVTAPASTLDRLRIYPDHTTGTGATVELDWIYVGDGTYLSDLMREPLFIGRTTPAAFKRNSPSKYTGTIEISAEDYISELGEAKLRASHAYNSDTAAYKLVYSTDETLSLFHLITRLVSKHTIKNYALNSGFENTTISNSWVATGLMLTRSNTTSVFGTYSGKSISTGVQWFMQRILFVGADLINIGDLFNFSIFINQGVSNNCHIELYEINNAWARLGPNIASSTNISTGIFSKYSVSLEISSPYCAGLEMVVACAGADTFYTDGAMLIRNIDALDYYVANNNDVISGSGYSDSATSATYDTLAFDTPDVDLAHPYAIAPKGDNVWDNLKDISDASCGTYLGMTADGVLQYRTAYNSVDPACSSRVDNISGIESSIDVDNYNSITVSGIVIDKQATSELVVDGSKISGIQKESALGKMYHAIATNDYLYINGASEIELKYSEEDE